MDEVNSDQALRRIVDRQVELLGQMVGQRARSGEDVIEAATVASIGVDGARPERCPAALVVLGAVAVGTPQPRLAGPACAVARHRPIAVVGPAAALGLIGPRPRTTCRLGARLVALQQRIALELGLHKRSQFEIGELEQTNGLLQLGGHHQLLALSQLQLWRKHHYRPDRHPTGSSYTPSGLNRTCPQDTRDVRLYWL